MNVLMLHCSYQSRGGEDESFETECRLLRHAGHFVRVIHLQSVRVSNTGLVKIALGSVWSQNSYFLVDEALQSQPFDVMHVQNFFPLLSPAVYFAAKKHGVPVVQSLRNFRLLCPSGTLFRNGKVCEECIDTTWKLPGILHGCYHSSHLATSAVAGMAAVHSIYGTWSKCVDMYICLTDHQRSKMIEGGFPAAKLIVKPNSVFPDPGAGAGSGDFCVFVGRLTPEKGIHTLLSAWKSCEPSWQLRIIGDGPLANVVQSAAERQRNIEWLGAQPTSAVLELIGKAKLLIFPSEWYEAFGRVAIESFAKGTPVLASRIGAICNVVPESGPAALFSAGDAEDLLRKLKLMLADPELCNGKRYLARKEYEHRFSGTANVVELLEIYKKVISLK